MLSTRSWKFFGGALAAVFEGGADAGGDVFEYRFGAAVQFVAMEAQNIVELGVKSNESLFV